MSKLEFVCPLYLLFFCLLVFLLYKDFGLKKQHSLLVSSTRGMAPHHWVGKVFGFLKMNKYLVLTFFILALAQPRSVKTYSDYDESKAVDIILAVDVSFSMLAKDLQPDRLTALKRIAKEFIKKRPLDRIGLVAYSGESFLKVPLTTDHQVIINEIDELDSKQLLPGTAIGNGLASAVKHIQESKGKSKVVILMTDGVDTSPNALNPIVAAEMAKNNHVKVYTIGIGTNGFALTPTKQDFFGDLIFTEEPVNIDEDVLKKVAEITNGSYFRATDNQKLSQVYNEINRLERTDVKVKMIHTYTEYFRYFLAMGLMVLLIDLFLRWGIFKTLN